MLKYLLAFGILAAGPAKAPEPPPAPPPPEEPVDVIKDLSECNHPALQIHEFKLVQYQADFKNDFAFSIYWKMLPDGKIQRVIVSRRDCKSAWHLDGIDVISPYGEKL